MKPTLRIAALVVVAVLTVSADSIVLRSGKKVTGTYLGGSARHLEFQAPSGELLKFDISDVASMTFSAPPVAAEPPKSQHSVMISAGTVITVRTIDSIDVDSSKAGAKFRASTDDPIMLGGDVVVPRGVDAVLLASKVQQGGRIKGSDLIELKIQSLSIAGKTYPVVTAPSETKSAGEGKKSAGKILGGAGLGAIIGGIAGGGTGAAIGALAGGAGGTVLSATSQPHLKIPSETRLQFQLTADLRIRQ